MFHFIKNIAFHCSRSACVQRRVLVAMLNTSSSKPHAYATTKKSTRQDTLLGCNILPLHGKYHERKRLHQNRAWHGWLTVEVAAGRSLVASGNQVKDRCQSYLPPGPHVSFGRSLSSVSADNVLHTTIHFTVSTGMLTCPLPDSHAINVVDANPLAICYAKFTSIKMMAALAVQQCQHGITSIWCHWVSDVVANWKRYGHT